MKVLVYVPSMRTYALSLNSIMALDCGDHDVVIKIDKTRVYENHKEDLLRKYSGARAEALADFDCLMTLEDDIMVPPDAMLKLIAHDAPVAYGITVNRHGPPHVWTPCKTLVGDTATYHPLSEYGNTVDVEGCGFFCTLISHEALSAVAFRPHHSGEHYLDIPFSNDLRAAGIRQIADLSVVCAHLLDETHALYPTAQGCSMVTFDEADSVGDYEIS